MSVGGEVVTDPARDVDEGSGVAVEGHEVRPETREVWAVNKPLGVTSTAREPGRRRAVVDLVESPLRLYPVGRLDADSTGLILLTNDGELANLLTHPRYEVPRTYRAKLKREPTENQLRRLRRGIELDDGPTALAEVDRVGPREIELTIREGRNRQIRRMADAVGNRVESLVRTGFGSMRLEGLDEGAARRLGSDEIERLWEDARR